MLKSKTFRSLFAVILAFSIAWNGFVSPVFAGDDSVVSSIGNGFWEGIGAVVGGITGTIFACYAVDVMILPIAPPVAGYLATVCPVVGGTAGAAAGMQATATAKAH